MIFGRLTPWQSTRARHLLRACFHVDSTKAGALAARWFAKYDLNESTYAEHRLLVHLLARFPALELAPTTASRLKGLKRQLWARGHINLKAARSALDLLDDFGISWVLTGAAQWFVQPECPANEAADIVEICVPEPARSTALHLLAQNGWRADYTTPDAATGPVFARFSKGQAALKLSKTAPLFHYMPAQQENLWECRIPHSHESGIYFLPAPGATFAMTLGRTHPKYMHDDQWVFDMFNQSPDPKSMVQEQALPSETKRRIANCLHTQFYK